MSGKVIISATLALAAAIVLFFGGGYFVQVNTTVSDISVSNLCIAVAIIFSGVFIGCMLDKDKK